jgi:hypothetical protein
MAIPTQLRFTIDAQMQEYCARKIPEHVRDQVRMSYTVRGNNVTLIEERRSYADPAIWSKMPIAQFRYDETDRDWLLYCADRHSRWMIYGAAAQAHDLRELLDEVDRDPTGIFWG